MEYTFTVGELWTLLLAMMSAIVLTGNAGKTIFGAIEARNRPDREMENRMTKVERKLDSDDIRLQKLEEGNRILLEANLALLKHGIDGNEVHAMESAQCKVTDFLLNR